MGVPRLSRLLDAAGRVIDFFFRQNFLGHLAEKIVGELGAIFFSGVERSCLRHAHVILHLTPWTPTRAPSIGWMNALRDSRRPAPPPLFS